MDSYPWRDESSSIEQGTHFSLWCPLHQRNIRDVYSCFSLRQKRFSRQGYHPRLGTGSARREIIAFYVKKFNIGSRHDIKSFLPKKPKDDDEDSNNDNDNDGGKKGYASGPWKKIIQRGLYGEYYFFLDDLKTGLITSQPRWITPRIKWFQGGTRYYGNQHEQNHIWRSKEREWKGKRDQRTERNLDGIRLGRMVSSGMNFSRSGFHMENISCPLYLITSGIYFYI